MPQELTLVNIASLGKCEHCGCIISMQDFSADAMDAVWKCPNCNGELTHTSFGYDQGGKGAKKVKWVGNDGEWVEEKPNKDFELENFSVQVGHSRLWYL